MVIFSMRDKLIVLRISIDNVVSETYEVVRKLELIISSFLVKATLLLSTLVKRSILNFMERGGRKLPGFIHLVLGIAALFYVMFMTSDD